MKAKHALNIPQEFIMSILNEQTGYFHQVEGWTLNCATIGAVLADLSLKSRIDTDEKTLFVIDSTKTGERVLDLCLAEIASIPDPKEPRYWIERLAVHSEDIIDATLKHLVQLKILTHHEGGFYTTNHCDWYAEMQQYPKGDTVGKYINSKIEEVIVTDIIPDPRDAMIIGLLSACDVIQFIFDLDAEKKDRIDLVCKLELINRVISRTVKEVSIAPTFRQSPLTKPIRNCSGHFSEFWVGLKPSLRPCP